MSYEETIRRLNDYLKELKCPEMCGQKILLFMVVCLVVINASR